MRALSAALSAARSPSRVGDLIFGALFSATVAHGVGSVGHFREWWTLSAFGRHWDADGFCVAHKGTAFDSHLLSMYGQAVLAVVLLGAVGRTAAGRDEIAVVGGQIESIFSHGIGHGVLYLASKQRGGLPRDEPLITPSTPPLIAAALLATSLVFFWNLLQRTRFPAWLRAAQAIIAAVAIPTTIPLIMVFGITGLVVFGNLHLDSLCHGLCGEKDRFYALYALFQCLSMVAMWAEPLLCDSLLVHFGGHAFFDYSIPLGLIGYLMVASSLPPREKKIKAG